MPDTTSSIDNSSWTQRLSGDEGQRPNDHREPFQRDRGRILHSSAFRRLQSKTQIMGVGQHDFYRTRLTHSLEVSQIGTGITAQLKRNQSFTKNSILQSIIPSDALIESLCLAHDIGHPPFGHGGEIALNYMMHRSGGFEANAQTFRIITKLEPYTEQYGMNLTRRTMLGLIKYPELIIENSKLSYPQSASMNSTMLKASDWKPCKGLYQDDEQAFMWVLNNLTSQEQQLFRRSIPKSEQPFPFYNRQTEFKSFDASIMELADDIAYGVHDLEDAIALYRVNKEIWFDIVLPQLQQIDNQWARKHSQQLSMMLFSEQHHERKNAIGALVNHLITNIKVNINQEAFSHPLLSYQLALTPQAQPILDALKAFVFDNVIKATDIQQMEFKGQRMLTLLFEAFQTDPERLLPKPILQDWYQHQHSDKKAGNANRIICDHLASMSDEQATRTFNQLFAKV